MGSVVKVVLQSLARTGSFAFSRAFQQLDAL